MLLPLPFLIPQEYKRKEFRPPMVDSGPLVRCAQKLVQQFVLKFWPHAVVASLALEVVVAVVLFGLLREYEIVAVEQMF